MKRTMCTALLSLVWVGSVEAVVFLNELFINPAGSYDNTQEFIELLGTPGKKLDGYAVAFCNGTQEKYFASIPPLPALTPEIDEFFSLDGLSLGANGILVITRGATTGYKATLPDANVVRWNNFWNGGLDTPGGLENDGSNTIFLIRNRPGQTQADPGNPAGLRWGKDIDHDYEVIFDVDVDGMTMDQFGDGNLDKGQPNGLGGNTLDLKGASTLEDVSDDLEIVDEVSYEHDRGWEYDQDDRNVDVGADDLLKQRNVHALDDPQGLNPDALTRVDYRTKGPGWAPFPGATGEGPNGNNWQDTATEQWIRGESFVCDFDCPGGQGDPNFEMFFFDTFPNPDPNSLSGFFTDTPLWLVGTFNYANDYEYQIMAGRVNQYATAFIPGDADRDGDADQEDIDKIAAVFGNDDWIFSNSFEDAPESDDGDPATQTRPWDVDATGDNGIEPSDMQWTLNFQGDTTGRIVGVTYDSTTPSAVGVNLNSNAGVGCTVSTSVGTPRGATELSVGQTVEITVLGQVTAGANSTSGQENGIMQYVHDLSISTGGVLRVADVSAAGAFSTTRAAIETPLGTDGDGGVASINGYATSFVQGIGSAAPLYTVTLEAIGEGSAQVSIAQASLEKFAASTPHGLKVGHTNNHGNPSGAVYPAALSFSVVSAQGCTCGDIADPGLGEPVNLTDFSAFSVCFGLTVASNPECECADLDVNGIINLSDFSTLSTIFAQAPANSPPFCLE